MTRTRQTFSVRILTALLCLSLIGWSILPSLSHVPRLAEMLSEHAQMTADHGHSHGFSDDLLWALHGHSHEAIDHDHSQALAVAASGDDAWLTARDAWHLRAGLTGPTRNFRIERPPRA